MHQADTTTGVLCHHRSSPAGARPKMSFTISRLPYPARPASRSLCRCPPTPAPPWSRHPAPQAAHVRAPLPARQPRCPAVWDSPPTSRMSAPSFRSCSQWRRAPVEACVPPSEKESGVALTMPITWGRVNQWRSGMCNSEHGRKKRGRSPVWMDNRALLVNWPCILAPGRVWCGFRHHHRAATTVAVAATRGRNAWAPSPWVDGVPCLP